LPSATAALDLATRPLPSGVEARHRASLDLALSRVDDRAARAVLARPLDARGEPQHLGSRKPGSGRSHHLGLPSVSVRSCRRPRIDPLHALERLGVLDQHAGLRAAADADHDRHRRGEAERARAGDDQHRDGGDQRVGEARLGPNVAQAANASSATAITAGTNQPATWSARRWIGARERCACATICTICASMVSRPTFARSITSRRLVERAADHLRAGSLVTGIDSPVTIDSSTR
jgi:hypothetical protein